MKFFLLIFLFSFVGCKNQIEQHSCDCSIDSARIVDSMRLNALLSADIDPHDTIIKFDDKLYDSLRNALYLANFRIERVRFYLNICLKNSSQDKFLKGWIGRAIK
jgi:hypothetical protein